MPFNPYNPVIEGLTNGFSMAHMIRQAQVQDQQLALQKQRIQMEQDQQAQEMQTRDLNARMFLSANTRPVNAGMVEMPAPDAPNFKLPEGMGTSSDGATIASGAALPAFTRKADPSQTVRYKTQGGGTIEGEILSPKEQMQRRLDEARSLSDIRTQGAIAEEKGKFDATSMPMPEPWKQNLGFPAGQDVRIPQHGIASTASAVAAMQGIKGKHVLGHGVIPGLTDQSVYVIDDKGEVTVSKTGVGPRPFAPQRTPQITPHQQFQQNATQEAKALDEAASLAVYQSPDIKTAQGKLDNLAAQSPFVKKNYAPILKRVKAAVGKQTDSDVLAGLDKALNGDKAGAGTPAPAAKPAKGKANGDQIKAFAQQKGISFKAAVAQAKSEGYDVTGLE